MDGTLLEAPCEHDVRGCARRSAGAYPAFKARWLVFAMGPPENQPPFPEYDTYTRPRATKLVPFSNVYPMQLAAGP